MKHARIGLGKYVHYVKESYENIWALSLCEIWCGLPRFTNETINCPKCKKCYIIINNE